MICSRCKVEMVKGIALPGRSKNNVCFGFGFNMMNHKTIKIIECFKCPKCGESDDGQSI